MLTTSRSMKGGRRPADSYSKQAGESVLGDEIKSFELDNFNPEVFVISKCQIMSEKLIRRLCVELTEHKRLSSLEMQRNVFENYKVFIGTAREIEDLEGELSTMKSLLASQSNIIHSMIQNPPMVDARDISGDTPDYPDEDFDYLDPESRHSNVPDELDVALAERRVDEALRLLRKSEDLLKSGSLDTKSCDYIADVIQSRRSELIEQLAELSLQPSVRGAELRAAMAALRHLGEGSRAHTLLLQSHGQKMRIESQTMKPSSAFYSGAYAASFSQLVFSAVARAARDSLAVFGGDSSFSSELVLWAHDETEWCAGMLIKHVLAPAASSGSLRSVAECLQIVLGHCELLEEQGLSLGSILYRLFRPFVEQALENNISRILESVVAVAVADDWYLQPLIGSRGGSRSGGSLTLRLTASAERLLTMITEFLEDVLPVIHLQLTNATLEGILHLFEEYMAMMNKALLGDDAIYDADGMYTMRRAEDFKQQLALVSNALILSEEVPRLASKLAAAPEKDRVAGMPAGGGGGGGLVRSDSFKMSRSSDIKRSIGNTGGGFGDPKRHQLQQWRKQLTKSVDNLRVTLCTQLATDLLYSFDDGEEPKLPSDYFFMDHEDTDLSSWRENPMPSDALQQYYWTTISITRAAADVLAGRDRVATQLLTQFSVALLNLVCHNEMWEDSRFFVGPIGLHQFLFDMNFLKEVAVKYHFASRQLRDIAESSMDKAREAFNVADDLLEDVEFQGLAKEAIAHMQAAGGPGGDYEVSLSSSYSEGQ